MSIITALLKLAAQLAFFATKLSFQVLMATITAIWNAFQRRRANQKSAPRKAFKSPLARAVHRNRSRYHRRRYGR